MSKQLFKVSLNLGGEVLEAKGETISEALGKMEPRVIKTKAIITVEVGDKKAELMLMPRFMRKLLVNPLSRLMLEKRFAYALK